MNLKDCPVYQLYDCSHANSFKCSESCDIRLTHESCRDIQPALINENDIRIEHVMRQRFKSEEALERMLRIRLGY